MLLQIRIYHLLTKLPCALMPLSASQQILWSQEPLIHTSVGLPLCLDRLRLADDGERVDLLVTHDEP